MEDDHAQMPPSSEPIEDENVEQEREERSFVFEKRLERAAELWEQGKVKFREGQFDSAFKDFDNGLYHLDFEELSYNFELQDTHREQIERIRVPLWLNTAQCLINLDRSKEALPHLDKVLKMEPNNVKALYRKAKVDQALGETELAFKGFKKAFELDKTNVQVRRALAQLQEQRREDQKQVDEFWKDKLSSLAPTTAVDDPVPREHTDFFLVAWFWHLVNYILSLFKSKHH